MQSVPKFVSRISMFAIILISSSRWIRMISGYGAPFRVYASIPNSTSRKNCCVSAEWYRFPSSYFLPSNVRLKYLSFENAGQLPRPYPENVAQGTRIVDPMFNDMNRAEPSTYTTLDSCDYLVELRENDDMKIDISSWNVRGEFSFLNRNSCSGLRRAFWIPFIPDPCEISSYVLLERNDDGVVGLNVATRTRDSHEEL